MVESKKRSVLRLALLVVFAFLVVGATTVAFALPSIVEWLVVRVLVSQGVTAAELTVEKIDWQRLHIAGIRIGIDDPLSANSVTVDYSFQDLMAQRVGGIDIQGLRLTARFDSDGISLGPIDPLLKGGGGEQSWTVGSVDVRDTLLIIETPFADLRTKLDGNATHRSGEDYGGTLRLAANITPKNRPPFKVTGTVEFEGSAAAPRRLEVDLTAQDPPIPMIEARQAHVIAALDKNGTKLRAVVDATQGQIRLDTNGPPMTGPPDQLAGRGTLSFDLENLVVAGLANVLSIAGALDLSYNGKVLNVDTQKPIVAALADITQDDLPVSVRRWLKFPISLRLEQLKLKGSFDDDGPRLAGRMALSVGANDGQSLKGTLAGSAAMDATGTLSAAEPIRFSAAYKAPALALPGTKVANPAISMAGVLRLAPDSIVLSLEKPLEFTAREITSETGPVVARKVRLRATQDGASFLAMKRAGAGAGSMRVQTRLSIPETSLHIADVPAIVHLPTLRVKAALAAEDEAITLSVDMQKGQVVLPQHAVSVNAIESSVEVGQKTTILLRSAELRHIGIPPQIVPLKASGRASINGAEIAFSGRVSDPLGRAVVDLSGTHKTASGAGTATLKLHPLTFLPGAFQPSDLLPDFGEEVSAASGAIAGGGTIAWSAERLSSNLRVTLTDISLTTGGLRVEGVNMSLALDQPWPISSLPKQRLTVSRISAGIPFDNATTTFRIDPNGLMLVDRGGVELLGGRVETESLAVAPQSPNVETVLRVSGVDVAEIMTVADVEGATGTGRLSGHIPVRFKDGVLEIRNGVLEAESPGVLRYKPAVPPPALQGSGEQISLVRGALENFHYKTLRLDLNGRTGGEWTTKLHLNGKNPDFMEGYPFEFNLNLSGKLDEIIRSGLESYQHPERLGKGARPPAP